MAPEPDEAAQPQPKTEEELLLEGFAQEIGTLRVQMRLDAVRMSAQNKALQEVIDAQRSEIEDLQAQVATLSPKSDDEPSNTASDAAAGKAQAPTTQAEVTDVKPPSRGPTGPTSGVRRGLKEVSDQDVSARSRAGQPNVASGAGS